MSTHNHSTMDTERVVLKLFRKRFGRYHGVRSSTTNGRWVLPGILLTSCTLCWTLKSTTASSNGNPVRRMKPSRQ